MTLRECVEQKFELVSKEDIEEVINWICKAWDCDENLELTENDVEVICDRHYEPSEEEMFNWIHDGDDESPTEIHNASWVTELENVLIVKNGGCYFWYGINY